MNNPRYLIASDFDGTLFDTSRPSPSGMTVEKAYAQSLDDIFGLGFGDYFLLTNGFHGESPSQIVAKALGMRDQTLIDNAKRMHEDNNGNFPTIIPESKNGIIYWDEGNPQAALTSMLVLQKLGYLLQEIGKHDQNGNPWPLPFEGVLNFFKSLSSLKKEGFPIDLAIISSGHESFIKKALDVWNIPKPDILVTEDDVRLRKFPLDRFKPEVFPVALAHFQWLQRQGISISRETGFDTRTRIMHIGDTPNKDLEMARKAGIEPNLLFPDTSWNSITEALMAKRNLLDGRPFSTILESKRNGKETNGHNQSKTEMPHTNRRMERV